MSEGLAKFLERYRAHFSVDEKGAVRQYSPLDEAIATDRIIESLPGEVRASLPELGEARQKQFRFSKWVAEQPKAVLAACDLAIPMPPAGVHIVRSADKIFYDFRNTDIVVEEFRKAGGGVEVRGTMLDFGCSSGRNVATLRRAFPDLDIAGVDPAKSSIRWARKQMPFARFQVSGQNPPLDFPDGVFDLAIAKSIWTHFSANAARAWLREMARVLKPGGHFLFSTHGPHDIAYRLTYNKPQPHYERFAGHPRWTRDLFLADAIRGLDEEAFYFQPYKQVAPEHVAMREIDNVSVSDWGLAFMLPDYLAKELLPPELKIVSRGIGRTGNRHDLYIVRRV
jgi:SAM-dependent methyltransferase